MPSAGHSEAQMGWVKTLQFGALLVEGLEHTLHLVQKGQVPSVLLPLAHDRDFIGIGPRGPTAGEELHAKRTISALISAHWEHDFRHWELLRNEVGDEVAFELRRGLLGPSCATIVAHSQPRSSVCNLSERIASEAASR